MKTQTTFTGPEAYEKLVEWIKKHEAEDTMDGWPISFGGGGNDDRCCLVSRKFIKLHSPSLQFV